MQRGFAGHSQRPRGLYEFTPLPVGSYTLTINKDGFRPITIRDIDFEYGETRTIDTNWKSADLPTRLR